VRRAGPAALALVVGLGLWSASASVRAQEFRSPNAIGQVVESVPKFQLQLRFGPYYPAVDSSAGLDGARPFEAIFGTSSELLFELDLDYQIWRGFGALTIGGSFGFVQFVGKGRTQDGSVASDTTVFNLVPLRLTLGYHFTKLIDWFHLPVVPYIQGGLSYYIWWVTDGVGDTASWTDPVTGSSSEGAGGIFGLHFGGGLKLLLDWLDQEAAAGLENDIGVINTFLFAEYDVSWVDGFGADNRFDVSDSTFMFGLMFEF
jgi:hypothetical protein